MGKGSRHNQEMGRTVKSFSFDAKKESREKSRQKFKASTNAEREFARQLRKVAKAAGHIVERHVEGASLADERAMMKALREYSKTITPWATKQAAKMLEKVSKSNKLAYKRQSKAMGAALQSNLAEQNTGDIAMALLHEQVGLIQSIPLEAGIRAQEIAAKNFLEGRRAFPDPDVIEELKQQMGMTTEVAENRARLIARTETARANASFVQARASALGVKGYIWRTTMDGAERESHAEMNGRYVEYSKPPKLSDGMQGHAGSFPNCRCYQDPVLPED